MCNGRQIWAELNRQKRIFVEPKERTDILQLFNDFDKTVQRNPNGAILFSVCRGKVKIYSFTKKIKILFSVE